MFKATTVMYEIAGASEIAGSKKAETDDVAGIS
jgi:hypothetical protein